MSRVQLAFVSLLALSLPAQDQANRLPVRRVVLYKNGVGYFEHLGSVRDNQQVSIPFTSGQLNDVLKSMTVLDLGGGRVTGVTYGSSAPVDRQLGDLRLPVGEKPTLTDFLGALRGARIEIRNGTTVISGRLLSIEHKSRIEGAFNQEIDYISVLTDKGEVRTTEFSPAFSVRLLEPDLPRQVGRFLDVVSSGREADVRQMVISTAGSGERPLFVSYISEVPVWKTTYRLVLNPGKAPLLQGWAIVDNTVGQDWNNVELSLVAGAPQSFVQSLSQPYYSRRPVVALPDNVSAAPQTYERTLVAGTARLAGVVTDPTGAGIAGASVRAFDDAGTLIGETTANPAGVYELSGLPPGSARLEVASTGFRLSSVSGVALTAGSQTRHDVELQVGSVTESVVVSAGTPSLNTETSVVGGRTSGRMLGSGSTLGRDAQNQFERLRSGSGGAGAAGAAPAIEAARQTLIASAVVQNLGDLYEYKLKDPITIEKNQSAMVPIINAAVAAEKVSVWNGRGGLPQPLRALWLTNTSGVTLAGGSFSVIEDETFAGEGIVDSLQAGEKRIVSYAIDLALNASSKLQTDRQRVTKVKVERGVLTQQSRILEKTTYTFRNEDTAPRTVIVEHPVRPNYELMDGGPDPVEKTSSWLRFRLEVPSKQSAELVVSEVRPLAVTYRLSQLTDENLRLFLEQKTVNKPLEEALARVLKQKSEIAELKTRSAAIEQEQESIFDDQERLRENMKSLKGSPEEKALLQRYTRQLDAQEDRLTALRADSKNLDTEIEGAEALLNSMIEDMAFDFEL